jgi:membrane-bound ClpP family serine protease
MARRAIVPRREGFFEALSTSIGAATYGFISDAVSLVTNRVNTSVEDVMDTVQVRAVELQKNLLNRIAVGLVYTVAGLFIVLAAFYYLTQHLGVSKALVFGILGITLLIIGFILKSRTRG